MRRYILDNVADVARATTTSTGCGSTPCTRSSDASDRAPAGGDGDRGGRAVGPPAPAADADRRVRPQRPAAGHARARRGGYGLDAQWSDDFHHAVHVALTGETDRLLRRLRAARPRWPRCARTASSTTAPARRSAAATTASPIDTARDADLAAGGLQPEPRPDRQPRASATGSPSTLDDDQLACAALLTLAGPFTPMLFQGEEWAASTPFQFFTSHPEPELGQGDRRGPDRGVRADGLGPGRRARPAGPGDVRSAPSWTGRSSAGGRHARMLDGLPAARPRCAARCPELTDPSFERDRVHASTRTPGCSRCAAATLRGRRELRRRPRELDVDLGGHDGELLFATGDGVGLAPDGRLTLAPHAGAVVAPVG